MDTGEAFPRLVDLPIRTPWACLRVIVGQLGWKGGLLAKCKAGKDDLQDPYSCDDRQVAKLQDECNVLAQEALEISRLIESHA